MTMIIFDNIFIKSIKKEHMLQTYNSSIRANLC